MNKQTQRMSFCQVTYNYRKCVIVGSFITDCYKLSWRNYALAFTKRNDVGWQLKENYKFKEVYSDSFLLAYLDKLVFFVEFRVRFEGFYMLRFKIHTDRTGMRTWHLRCLADNTNKYANCNAL